VKKFRERDEYRANLKHRAFDPKAATHWQVEQQRKQQARKIVAAQIAKRADA
jgi:hypothetical protein